MPSVEGGPLNVTEVVFGQCINVCVCVCVREGSKGIGGVIQLEKYTQTSHENAV